MMVCVVWSLLDVSCGHQCLVPFHKTAVWALPLSTDCPLPGPLLWPGLRPLVPVQVKLWRIQVKLIVSLLTQMCYPSLDFLSHPTHSHPHTAVCTRVTSPSWCPRWSLRAMHHCGSQQLASTKSGSPSALTPWWRCAPRAWVLRQRHCGSVCFCKSSLQPLANAFIHQSSDRWFSSSSCETWTCPVCARAWW